MKIEIPEIPENKIEEIKTTIFCNVYFTFSQILNVLSDLDFLAPRIFRRRITCIEVL